MQPLAVSTWGDEERQALLDVIESGRFTMGEKVAEFEKQYADWTGTDYAVMCNSGSSANLLMVAAYTLRFGAGTVIVPAVSWSTSYSPFQQYGWKLKFVDIDSETLNYDIKALNEAYTGTEIILAVNLLGNPNQYLDFPSTLVLEDNCESMGAELDGIKTGCFGMMSSHSTFFSHHMQTMEGGIVTTDNEYFYEMLLCLRSHGWTRHLPENNLLNVKPSAYEFIFPGYNVRPIEMMAAVGIEQLKKLDGFIQARRDNAERWREHCHKRGWWMQKEIGKSSWFAFAIVDDDIEEIKKELQAEGTEYRPIVAGNFTRSASINHYNHEIYGTLTNADRVQDKGIYIGNTHKEMAC
jgi:CDP-6-deoxy-D-xylo-4-hexulose-3-dehydrase